MGLLDDLRNQAEGRRQQEEEQNAEQQRRDAIYRDEIHPRLARAYQYFHELVKHLNYVQPEILVDYPLYTHGGTVRLRQGDYAVVSDSSDQLKQVVIGFRCTLTEPVQFEVSGKDAVLGQSDRLDRYPFHYQRHDQKDTSLELEAARFTLEGPLPVKVGIEADVAQSVIRLTLRNFSDPGSSHYSLQPADLDEDFLERLGKFLLRQETVLFGSHEMPDEARQSLRRRIEEEKAQRDQELREAEETLRAEEDAQRAHNKAELLKDAVRKTVDENRERLKDLFGKLKAQAGTVRPPEK